jgi:hypothetical protein
MPTSNAIDWQIENIRGTVFVDGQLNPAMLETWIGEVSENSPSKVNKTSSSFIGISKSSSGFLRTSWNADRLDVILSSEEPKQGQPIAPISNVSSLFERFVDRIPEIGELVPVDRIALGLVLVFQVPSEAEGLEILLSSMLSGITLPSSARDFLYRVNYPRESQIHSGLKLNRLATWSVSQVQVIRSSKMDHMFSRPFLNPLLPFGWSLILTQIKKCNLGPTVRNCWPFSKRWS